MNPQTGKAHGRAARRNGSKAHGRAARGDDGDDKTIDKGGGGIDGTDGFELPQLNDQRNTLRCAVGTCAADYSRVWHHADDRRQDPRRVCGRCAQRWPDITAHYPAKQQVFDYNEKPAHVHANLLKVHDQLAVHIEQVKLRRVRRVRAAAVIQSAQRAHALWRTRTSAAVRLQNSWRRIKVLRLRAHAAVRIQALRRGKATRAHLRLQAALKPVIGRILRSYAAIQVQRLWLRTKARTKARRACVRMIKRVCATRIQAATRRLISVPRMKVGARVRMRDGVHDDDDWSASPLTNELFNPVLGTVTEIGSWYSCGRAYRFVVVKSDDATRPQAEYYPQDIKPIVDGEPIAASAWERRWHAQRHAAAAHIQALQRARKVRRRMVFRRWRASAVTLQARVRCAITRPLLRLPLPRRVHDSTASLATGAPAFTFGGVGR